MASILTFQSVLWLYRMSFGVSSVNEVFSGAQLILNVTCVIIFITLGKSAPSGKDKDSK